MQVSQRFLHYDSCTCTDVDDTSSSRRHFGSGLWDSGSLHLIECIHEIQSCKGRCSRSFVNHHKYNEDTPCSCDPQCRYVFGDCCADFEFYCASLPKDTTHHLFKWECRNIFKESTIANIKLHMVDSCMQGWPNDQTSINCSTRNPKSFHDILLAVPVVNENEVLFRNIYCAFCNGFKPKDVSSWEGKFPDTAEFNHSKALISETKDNISYDPFIIEKDVNISEIRLHENMVGARICLEIDKNCTYTQNRILVEDCKNRPAALISDGKRNFKNQACLTCNYQNESSIPRNSLTCGPKPGNPEEKGLPSIKYSLILGQELYMSFTTEKVCPDGYIFDPNDRRCLKTYKFPRLSSLQTVRAYYISLEYESKSLNTTDCLIRNRSNEDSVFKNAFERILHNKTNNTGHVSVLKVIPAQNRYLVALHVVNSIQKEANNLSNNVTYNTTQITSQIKDFTVKIKTPIEIDQCQYIPKRVWWREMVCVENKTFPIAKQNIQGKTTIYLKETQRNYSEGEFWVFEKENNTVVVICEHFRPVNCSDYINVTEESDWVLHDNLSLFYNVTGTFFKYGDYSIKNNTVWLCLSETLVLNQPTKTIEKKSIHDAILSWLSVVANIVSITSLVALVAIYSIFKTLRNLPGKNVMLLSTVLAIAQLLWLLKDQISRVFIHGCDVILIALHYFFLASFTSSGSIAYHSYTTFYSIARGRLNRTQSRFVWYMIYSLGCPGITVALFRLIDFFNILKFEYDETLCWFGKGRGLYITFLGPLFLQLFVNLVLLVATLKWIYKSSQTQLALGENNSGVKRRHIGIYLRISALMGLTWIFAVLLLAFPGVVLDYLFNVVNGLQGFYIALAFLSTKTVRKLFGCKTNNQRERSTMTASQTRDQSMRDI